jgi:hypothetical protein
MPDDITIAEPMEDNDALRYIVAEMRALRAIAAQQYDAVNGVNTQAISNTAPYERDETPTAVKTVITNLGAQPARVYEGGALVAVLAQYETWVSPLNGGGALLVDTAASSSTIAVATYTRA